jgi:hypothetical protein
VQRTPALAIGLRCPKWHVLQLLELMMGHSLPKNMKCFLTQPDAVFFLLRCSMLNRMFAPLREHRFSFVPPYLFPLTVAIFPPLLFAVTYPLTYAEVPKSDNKVIFLSATIDYPPMSCIGSLGLMFGSILLLVCSFLIFMRNKDLMRSGDMTSRKLNRAALVLAVLTAFGCSGVAAFQQHLYLIVHLVFAGLFFISGVVYINVIVYMESWRDERTAAWKIRRAVAFLSTFVGASGKDPLHHVPALRSLSFRHRCRAGHELRAGKGVGAIDLSNRRWRRNFCLRRFSHFLCHFCAGIQDLQP